jgi:hypothetical protein
VTTRLRVTRTHTRTGIGPSVLDITRTGRKSGDLWLPGASSHVLTDAGVVATESQVIDSWVDELMAKGAPLGVGREKLRNWALANSVDLPRNDVLADVVKALKARPR